MLVCHRTPFACRSLVCTDSRGGEGGTLKVRGRDTKHVSCVCVGERQPCGRKTIGVALETILLFRVFEKRETLKTNILVRSSTRGSATTLTLS